MGAYQASCRQHMPRVHTPEYRQRSHLSRATGGRLAEERTADVQVCVYEYTDLEKLATLDCGTELRCSALALSACGRYLLAVGDAPDFVLTVWDWETHACLLRTTVPEQLVGGGVSFSTADVEGTLTFVVTGRHAVRVHTLQRLRNAWHLTCADVDVHTHSPTTHHHAAAAVSLTAHCWLPDGQLYLGNDAGELMVCIRQRASQGRGGLSRAGSLSLRMDQALVADGKFPLVPPHVPRALPHHARRLFALALGCRCASRRTRRLRTPRRGRTPCVRWRWRACAASRSFRRMVRGWARC